MLVACGTARALKRDERGRREGQAFKRYWYEKMNLADCMNAFHFQRSCAGADSVLIIANDPVQGQILS